MGEARTRRAFLTAGVVACAAWAQKKGDVVESAARRYSDPTTENDVHRLTDPAFNTTMPAFYGRIIARNSLFMLVASDRPGAMQAYRLDLKTAQMHQLTEAESLDPATLTLTPDNRSFCYFAGRSLWISNLTTLHEREIYRIPEGWERGIGMSVGPDGTHAVFVERKSDSSRLRMAPFLAGAARTILETPLEVADPISRPMRAQVLYRQGSDALWIVNQDGQQNRKLKIAAGGVACANWSPDGKTILYLNLPADPKDLNTLRECNPDANTDKLLAKTSQFASFSPNRDASVFVGASRNAGSPYILLLLRITRRELTLCEHHSTDAAQVNPVFSPDSQRVYWQSDREGKHAIYSFHVEKLVEKTNAENSQ